MKPSSSNGPLSPEIVGLTIGSLMAISWPLARHYLAAPAWGLFALSILAVMAGLPSSAISSKLGIHPKLAVRNGARSAVWAVLTAGAWLVFMARTVPGSLAPWKGLSVSVASSLPAMLAGSIAASIGMLLFRTEVSEARKFADTDLTPPGKWAKWAARVVILMLIVGAFSAPFFPIPLPPAKSSSVPIVVSTPTAPPPPVFSYKAPEALQSASSIEWDFKEQRFLGNYNSDVAIRFSPDERFVVGMQGREVVIQELDRGNERRLPVAPFETRQIGFSPNGERLFLVSSEEPRRVAVLDIPIGRYVLPQPKNNAIPKGNMAWRRDNEVWFASGEDSVISLNLDTLLLDTRNVGEDELYRFRADASPRLPEMQGSRFSSHSVPISADLPETLGTKEWPVQKRFYLAIQDLEHDVVRPFSQIPFDLNGTYFGTKDGSKILSMLNGQLNVAYFTVRASPPLRYKIGMPHGPEELIAKDLDRKPDYKSLSAVLYRPMINPLNAKTVGADRSAPAALMRFARWEGTEAVVWISSDFRGQHQEYVISDVHVSADPPILLACNIPHRWWIPLPEPMADSSDISKIPTKIQEQKIVNETMSSVPAAGLAISENSSGETKPDSAIELQQIKMFLMDHHDKINNGNIPEMVQNYAEKVDYFNKGIIPREAILKDQLAYHRGLVGVREIIKPQTVRIERRNNLPNEVSYVMVNEWQRTDGSGGKSSFQIRLTLDRDVKGQWRILKQRSEPLN